MGARDIQEKKTELCGAGARARETATIVLLSSPFPRQYADRRHLAHVDTAPITANSEAALAG